MLWMNRGRGIQLLLKKHMFSSVSSTEIPEQGHSPPLSGSLLPFLSLSFSTPLPPPPLFLSLPASVFLWLSLFLYFFLIFWLFLSLQLPLFPPSLPPLLYRSEEICGGP